MTVCIKLTDENGQTRGGTQWAPGVRHEVEWNGGYLCQAGCLHMYEGPTERDALSLGILLDPHHGNFGSGRRAFGVEPGQHHCTDGTKSGTESQTCGGGIDSA